MATFILSALISTLLAPAGRDERGQGLVEYSLILALIVIVAIVSLAYFGTVVSRMLSDVGTSI